MEFTNIKNNFVYQYQKFNVFVIEYLNKILTRS